MTAKSWGCNSSEIAEWREELLTFERNREVVVASLNRPHVGATVYRGSPDTATDDAFGEGFTLHWTDYVANDWAETYDDVATAVLRMGLIAACENGGTFTDEAYEPADFADQARLIVAAYTQEV